MRGVLLLTKAGIRRIASTEGGRRTGSQEDMKRWKASNNNSYVENNRKLPILSILYKCKNELLAYTSFSHGPERKPYRIDVFQHRVDFDNPNDSKDDYNDSQREHSC